MVISDSVISLSSVISDSVIPDSTVASKIFHISSYINFHFLVISDSVISGSGKSNKKNSMPAVGVELLTPSMEGRHAHHYPTRAEAGSCPVLMCLYLLNWAVYFL